MKRHNLILAYLQFEISTGSRFGDQQKIRKEKQMPRLGRHWNLSWWHGARRLHEEGPIAGDARVHYGKITQRFFTEGLTLLEKIRQLLTLLLLGKNCFALLLVDVIIAYAWIIITVVLFYGCNRTWRTIISPRSP